MTHLESIIFYLLNEGDSTSHRIGKALNIKVRRVAMYLRKAELKGVVSSISINTNQGKKTVWRAEWASLPSIQYPILQAVNLVEK